jgi:hypothetical protein
VRDDAKLHAFDLATGHELYHQGAAGVYAAAQFGAYFDNLTIMPNQ